MLSVGYSYRALGGGVRKILSQDSCKIRSELCVVQVKIKNPKLLILNSFSDRLS